MNYLFFFNAVALGFGLAMDAFSVSLANGLDDPKMHFSKMILIAAVFAIYQTAMPLIGWTCIHTIDEIFTAFQPFVPWIALILLVLIGGKMVFDGVTEQDEETSEEGKSLGMRTLLIQGLATSIDALSVGFTTAEYNFSESLLESTIIGVTTFVICLTGIQIGKFFGTKLSRFASILGGVILIAIGLEIFLTHSY